AESFRKMLLAMAQDVRVILIKLADRLHNMRTLDAMAIPHRERIARETLDIYAPIANRLGLNALYQELQELSFKHLHPVRYGVLRGAGRPARAIQADSRQVQRLHRNPQGERLPVAAHHAFRSFRHTAGSADPRARHASHRGSRGGRTLAVQGRRDTRSRRGAA